MKKIVCHITSAHPAEDVRIFHKECISLVDAGYEVHLVAPCSMDYTKSGVKIHAISVYKKSRLKRMLFGVNQAVDVARNIGADIYHLHDPELLRVTRKLKTKSNRIIFDSHENVSKQILSKYYIIKSLRIIISKCFAWYEINKLKKLDLVICATGGIESYYKPFGLELCTVSNFPMLHEFVEKGTSIKRERAVCYVGGISIIRGIREMIELARLMPDVKFYIAGEVSDPATVEIFSKKDWTSNFFYLGSLSREDVSSLYHKCMVGLILFHPVPNHLESVPNKMFEYLAAGLPVVCSDFPQWVDLIEGRHIGRCARFDDFNDLSGVILEILNQVDNFHELSLRAKEIIQSEFNWEKESRKLLNAYCKIFTVS